jgi:predicted nucleic acid-binding protein
VIVVDASVAYALLDQRDAGHEAARSWYDQPHRDLLTTPLVLAEVDHLAAARLGRAARSAFLGDIDRGGYTVAWWSSAVADSVQIARRYLDLGVSLTDASLVALAARLETTSIATFDERHFRALQPLTGEPAFTLLPVDA